MRGEALAAAFALLIGGCDVSDACVRHSDCPPETKCGPEATCIPAPLDAAELDDAMPIDATPIDATPIDAIPPDAPPVDAGPVDPCVKPADVQGTDPARGADLRWRAPCSVLEP